MPKRRRRYSRYSLDPFLILTGGPNWPVECLDCRIFYDKIFARQEYCSQDLGKILRMKGTICGKSHVALPPGCSPPNVIPCGRVWQMVDHPNWLTQRLGNNQIQGLLSSSLTLVIQPKTISKIGRGYIYSCYNSKVLPLSLHQILIAAAGNSLIDLSPEGGWMWVRCSQSTLAPSRGPCKGDSGSYHENFNQFSSHLKKRIEITTEVNKFMKIKKIFSRYDEM